MNTRTHDKPNQAPAMLIAVFATMLASVTSASSTTTYDVRLWSEAVVMTDQVLLGDIATVSDALGTGNGQVNLAGIVVMDAPPKGQSAELSYQQIRTALRAVHVPLYRVNFSGAAVCKVFRQKTDPVPEVSYTSAADESVRTNIEQGRLRRSATLYNELHRWVERRFTNPRDQVEIEAYCDQPGLLDLSGPEYSFSFSGPDTPARLLGTSRFKVRIAHEQYEEQTVTITVTVRVFRQMVIATDTINRHMVILPEMVRCVRKSVRSIDEPTAGQVDDVAGMQACRMIAAGNVICMDDIEQVPLVKRGQLVTVEVHYGTLTVRSSGEALETGVKDDTVRVRRSSSAKRDFSARVVGPAQVRIDLSPSGAVTVPGNKN